MYVNCDITKKKKGRDVYVFSKTTKEYLKKCKIITMAVRVIFLIFDLEIWKAVMKYKLSIKINIETTIGEDGKGSVKNKLKISTSSCQVVRIW